MGTELAQMEKFDPKKYIVLHPVTITDEGQFSPVLAQTISFVKIRTEEEAGEVYHDFRFAPPPDRDKKRPGKYALTALGLGRIKDAAGLQVVASRKTDRQRDPNTGHLYVEWQVVAGVRQPNGEVVFMPASASLDTADFADERTHAYEEQIRENRHLYKFGPKKGKPRFESKDVPDMVRRDVIQIKAKLEERVETLALNRAIRKLLSLKQVYTEEEIQREFVVPRLIYRPDLTDPVQLEWVQVEGSRAVAALYGGSPLSSTNEERLADVRPLPDRVPSAPAEEESSVPAEGRGAEEEEPPAGEATASAPASRAKKQEPAGGLQVPKEDPLFEEGPHKGERMSYVAETDPSYLRGLLQGTRAAKKRELIEGWLRWQTPTLT